MYYILFSLSLDPQAVPPAAFCPFCGGERYAPSLLCLRCRGGMV